MTDTNQLIERLRRGEWAQLGANEACREAADASTEFRIKAETKTHKYSIRDIGDAVQMFVKPGAGGVECWTVWEAKTRCQSHRDSLRAGAV